MNERIRELEKQCYGYAGLHDDTIVFDKEKFAELIIKECARIAAATPFPDSDEEVRKTFGHTWDMACSESARQIRTHFGE